MLSNITHLLIIPITGEEAKNKCKFLPESDVRLFRQSLDRGLKHRLATEKVIGNGT